MAAGHDGTVAIAVSGGSDSLALLHLATLWAARNDRRLLVLSVDHGLRPEAAGEADFVCQKAEGLGHAARALSWRPEAPAGQAAARRARHALLAGAARDGGAGLLLLGHTRDDIEETFLMRLGRGSGLTGAASPLPVSVSPVWPDGRGLTLARPLWQTRRAALQAWLSAQGESWISDPGNVSDKYERARMRRRLDAPGEPQSLRSVVDDALLLRAVSDSTLSVHLRTFVRVDPSGLVILHTRPDTQAALCRLLSVLLQAAAGRDSPPDTQKLQALAVSVLASGPTRRVTLGGAWIQRRGDEILIGRDPGEAQRSWSGDIWDGRYERGGEPAGALPFLVRDSVPEGGAWREIISARLAHWAACLEAGAVLAVENRETPPGGLPYQTPRLSPVQT